jgi:integrase
MTSRSRVPVPKNPGIYKETSGRGVVSYLVRYRDAAGRERTKSWPTLAEARRFKAAGQVDRDRGTELDVTGGKVTFAQYSDVYVSRHPDWAPGTLRSNQQRLDSINKAIGHKRVRDLVTGDIAGYLAAMRARGLAPGTVSAHKSLITTVLGDAVNDRVRLDNPATPIKVPKVSRSASARSSILTPRQINALVENLPEWWHALAWTIALTGLRISEAAGLTVDRVNFLTGDMTIDRQLLGMVYKTKAPRFGPPKTPSSYRVLRMGDDVANLLATHIETHPLGVDGVIFTTGRGRPMAGGTQATVWQRATKDLEFPAAARGWHSLRHTYGSNLLANGVDVVTVSALLGHNGPAETLATYAHVDPTKMIESRNVAAEALYR